MTHLAQPDWDDLDEARTVARHDADQLPVGEDPDPCPVLSLTRPEYADRGHAADVLDELRRERRADLGGDAA